MPSELLDAVKGSPFLLFLVVVVVLVVWLVEKLGGLNGPFSRLYNAWANREVNRLEREAKVRALRRKIAREEETAEVRALSEKVGRLEESLEGALAELKWARRDRVDQINRDRLRADFDRQMVAWINSWLPRARAIGLTVDDPPSLDDLATLLVAAADREVEAIDNAATEAPADDWDDPRDPRDYPRDRLSRR